MKIISKFFTAMSLIAVLSVSGIANAAFLSRLGGLAYYDDVSNLTWLVNANYDVPLTWTGANAWAAGLSVGGVGGWRLPSADVNGDGTVVDCSGGGVANCSDNEMGFLFWEEGIKSYSQGPFSNLEFGPFWSGTELASSTNNAWYINLTFGTQFTGSKTGLVMSTLAVQSGDISAVPVPAAVYLFGSGLIGLMGVARRNIKVVTN